MTNDTSGTASVPPPPPLTAAERSELKARAHHLDPVVIVGDAGLTEGVLAETHRALNAHELIKVRVVGDDRAARLALQTTFADRLGCLIVQAIGKLLVLWRPRSDDEADRVFGRRRPKKAIPKKRLEARSEARAAARKAKPAGGRPTTGGRPAAGRIPAAAGKAPAASRSKAPSAPSAPRKARTGGLAAERDPDFGSRADERRARVARNQQNPPAGRPGRGDRATTGGGDGRPPRPSGSGAGPRGTGTGPLGSGSQRTGGGGPRNAKPAAGSTRTTTAGSASRPTTRGSTKAVGSPPASAGRGRTPASGGSARQATARLSRLKPSGGRGGGR